MVGLFVKFPHSKISHHSLKSWVWMARENWSSRRCIYAISLSQFLVESNLPVESKCQSKRTIIGKTEHNILKVYEKRWLHIARVNTNSKEFFFSWLVAWHYFQQQQKLIWSYHIQTGEEHRTFTLFWSLCSFLQDERGAPNDQCSLVHAVLSVRIPGDVTSLRHCGSFWSVGLRRRFAPPRMTQQIWRPH